MGADVHTAMPALSDIPGPQREIPLGISPYVNLLTTVSFPFLRLSPIAELAERLRLLHRISSNQLAHRYRIKYRNR